MAIIFTEAGKQYGYGHLIRCLAVAQGFEKSQIKPIFYLRGNPDVGEILKGFDRRSVDWLKARVDVKGRIVIVDSYHAGKNFCKQIYKEARKVIFIDDNKRIPYPGGSVLNSAILSGDIGYPDNPKVDYLLGPKYHPLRREFWEAPVKAIRERVEKVLVTFGGSDMTNETLRVIKILKEQYPDFKKSIIVGRCFSNINQIKTEADKNTVLIYSPDAQSMKREMLKTDICISGGGQTTYELARLGVPTIGICFAHNQFLNLTGFARRGFIKFAGRYNGKNVFNKIKECLDTLTYKNRLKMSRAGRKLVDGSGVKRVVRSILSNEMKKPAVTLRTVTQNDRRDIWYWRNCPQARKSSFNSKPVLWREHKKWFDLKFRSKKVKIYIAEQGIKKVGVIRFEGKGKLSTVSINLNPAFFGRGLGSEIIKLGTIKFLKEHHGITKVMAEIISGNIASQKAFEKAGYVFTRKIQKNGINAGIYKFTERALGVF